jgi:hypothetical protein
VILRGIISDDAERDRPGDRIRTGMVASTRHQGGAPADGEAAANGRASTGRASAAANPDAGVKRGVGSGVPSVGARGSSTSGPEGGVTCGRVTVSPEAARGGGWSPRRTGWPTECGAPCTSRRRGNGQ